jgi:hypothetical protein
MTIRLATINDTLPVMGLLREAHTAALSKFFEFDAAMAERQWMTHLASSESICLVYEAGGEPRGVFVGAATNYPGGPVRLAIEVVFWVSPQHRGSAWLRIMREFETWAKDKCCAFTSISSKQDERFSTALERRGYAPAETHYLKAVI